MLIGGNATPLPALDAVVLDTETTGLDARTARVLEIALVPIVGGRLDPSGSCRRLVRPDVAIPEQSTRIHGIAAATVADAPRFADAWPEMATLIGNRVVIGHAIGFDLAVLTRECERAGLSWTCPRSLDTRLLAEVATRTLAGYSLEQVAAWLGIEISDRHSALGDAITAARVFEALIPKLRDVQIRTLAEAERACNALTAALERQHRAGWTPPRGSSGADADMIDGGIAGGVDSYPYRHRVRDLMSAPAKFVDAEATLATVLGRMAEARVSSYFVTFAPREQQPTPNEIGIVTERDALRALASEGAEALQRAVGTMANRPVVSVPAAALAFLAMARMSRLRIRHLGVTDDSGRIIGAVSARDLLRLRAEGSIELGDEIEQAGGVHDLVRAWAKLSRVVAELLREGLTGLQVASLISHQLGALTQRAGALAEERLRNEGYGAAPGPYVLAVLGSAGRGESLLAMDQDNALIFADAAEGHDEWFAAFGSHVSAILDEVGVPYCKGGIMGKNPQWRGSTTTWRGRIGEWLTRSKPEDLLAVDIFFDMRGVHGDIRLAQQLWREAFDAAKGQIAFAKLLVDRAGQVSPGLSFLGRFRTENGRLDLKRAGLFGLVSAARALAVCHHVTKHSTQGRLAGITALGLGGETDLEGAAEAHRIMVDLLIAQQIDDLDRGIPVSNTIEIKRLSAKDRSRLRFALGAVANLNELARDLVFSPERARKIG
jgi:DNA polymerase-3 subunit epsilon/CBS domain-containing protein